MSGENTPTNLDHVSSVQLQRLDDKCRLEVSRLDGLIVELTARLKEEINSGDQQLLLHIQAQRDQVRSQKEAIDAALQAIDKQTLQAETHRRDAAAALRREQDNFKETVKEKFVDVNEFRGALDDLSKDMATRRELDALGQKLDERITSLNGKVDDRFREIQTALGALTSRLDLGPSGLAALTSGVAHQSGRSEGVGATAKALAAALASVLVLIGIYTALQSTRNQGGRNPPSVVTVTTPAPARGAP